MIKKIIILSTNIETVTFIKNELVNILGNSVSITPHSIYDKLPDLDSFDLVLFTSSLVENTFLLTSVFKTKYITLNRTIDLQNSSNLINLPKNTDVLIVSEHKLNCDNVIEQLKLCGIDQINYHYYYPDIEKYEPLCIAITPGEAHLAPPCVREIIDIGCRRIDVISMVEILMHLGILNEYRNVLFSYFYKNLFIDPFKQLIRRSNEADKFKNLLYNILNNTDQGIICTNIDNNVIELNKKTLNILGIERKHILGENIYDFFQDLNQDIAFINGQEVFITEKFIKLLDNEIGKIISIDLIDNIKEKDEKIRTNKNETNTSAKYTFKDIIGISKKNMFNINLAVKISKSNSTVLIQGETGTGKELFAQAIHNNSHRHKYPFVAINLASIPENLLESELFGYEEGAFSGAKKGGKEGLLKKAHKGTVFLDEIGDIPYHMQIKILRFIQEREIIPIGSNNLIPIDVRIIAATNKDLVKEVENKNFREDLLYRLNVMPVYTLPLRERKEDIYPLIDYYLKKFNYNMELNDFFRKESLEYLVNYNWPGNVRELVNVIEYLTQIKNFNEQIRIEDLPKYILKGDLKNSSYIIEFNPEVIWILEKMYKNKNIGRRGLSNLAKNERIQLGEGQIRTLMYKMKDQGLIEIKRGVNGTRILPKGFEFLKKFLDKGNRCNTIIDKGK
jgi:transcriptional regulator with PAS, ATPase and Fis domain